MTVNGEFRRVLTLTEREYEIFRAFGSGLTPSEIASIPGRVTRQKTVHNQLTDIMHKLRLANRYQLSRIAARYEMSGLRRRAVVPYAPYELVG